MHMHESLDFCIIYTRYIIPCNFLSAQLWVPNQLLVDSYLVLRYKQFLHFCIVSCDWLLQVNASHTHEQHSTTVCMWSVRSTLWVIFAYSYAYSYTDMHTPVIYIVGSSSSIVYSIIIIIYFLIILVDLSSCKILLKSCKRSILLWCIIFI